ncbi:MAG: twin-arginine translocase TatA/TatE family subunit [Fervidicoccaceae archaeon]
MPGSLGTPEIIAILVIALLLLGPSKLPQLARSIGEALREFRKAASGATDEEKKQISAISF